MKPPETSTSATALAGTPEPKATGKIPWMMCRDGRLTAADLQRAVGGSRKAAMREFDKWVDGMKARGETGFDLEVDAADKSEPPPGRMDFTRAELAQAIAKVAGLGRYGLAARIAERAATRPPPEPKKERRMSAQQHPWNTGRHGRAVRSVEGGGIEATLTCGKCEATETIRFRQLAGSAEMDRKFILKGWAVDPAKCPEHNRRHHPRKDPLTVASSPSPSAIAAQAKMFGLLQNHFDVENGCYGSGYSDAKIAAETGLAIDLVKAIREQAFGPLREPPEIAQLATDIEALAGLIDETVAPLKTELAGLRSKLAELRRKFGG